jgi:hypothetical protein
MKWLDKKVKTLHWYDISVLKLTVLAFALLIAKLWPTILALNIWVYVAVAVIGAAYLLWKMR